jgi:hypothetical protein
MIDAAPVLQEIPPGAWPMFTVTTATPIPTEIFTDS